MFAAIDIGSYELEMKIFEMSQKYGMRQIDDVRHRLDLGKDTFRTGKLSCELTDELCEVLNGFRTVLEEYRVSAVRVCTTSALREAKNVLNVLEQIRIRTGFKVEVLSNSEQRFLGYKAIASKELDFNKIIKKRTAIVDLGGGSMQFSLFDKDSLVDTKNIRWGFVRVKEILAALEAKTTHFHTLIQDLIDEDMRLLRKLYLKERKVENIIAVGDYMTYLTLQDDADSGKGYMTRKRFMELYDKVMSMSVPQIAQYLQIAEENAAYVLPSIIIYKRMIDETDAQLIWTPGMTLSDGIAYDYAQKKKFIKSQHNFENDITASARNVAKRYMSSKSHTAAVLKAADTIFDSTKKLHGLTKRERLLLEISALLHDCGKYISSSNIGKCSYDIIMNTEIIGLSHWERVIIANVVRYHTEPIKYYGETGLALSKEHYLVIEKLTAILRVANALDRSYRQRAVNMKAMVKERELLLTVDTTEDLTLEKGLFAPQADFFEEIFNIRPVIRQKKRI